MAGHRAGNQGAQPRPVQRPAGRREGQRGGLVGEGPPLLLHLNPSFLHSQGLSSQAQAVLETLKGMEVSPQGTLLPRTPCTY